jgi:outer membrane protein assembly factor BamB
MARRRDSRLLIEIDTSSDGSGSGADDGAHPGDGAPEPPRPSGFARRVTGPARERWQGLPRRARVAAVAGTVAIVLVGTGGAVVLDARADAAHAERMAALPGGVADLSAPLEQTWEVATDTGAVALLDGGLLVTVVGTEALAVDAATGEVAWRQELGQMIECGTTDVWSIGGGMEPQATVTCLVGRPERSVVVLGADGEVVGRRDLGVTTVMDSSEPAVREFAMITGDGGIAVGDQVDLELSSDDPQEALEELEALRADGTWRDPALRIEDALTGEIRGQGELTLETAADLAACAAYADNGAGGMWISGGAYGDAFGGASLSLCDEQLRLDADGTVSDAGVYGRVALFGDWAMELSEDGSTVTGPDGEEFFVEGYVMSPGVTDTFGGPFLAVTASGTAAFAEDGTELWASQDEVQPENFVANVGGVFVVQLAGGRVAALDAATGEERWNREVDPDAEAFGYPMMSLTDGSTVLLVVGAGSAARLVALDLADGRTLWESEIEGDTSQVLTVDGQVVLADLGGDAVTNSWTGEAVGGPSLRGYAVP